MMQYGLPMSGPHAPQTSTAGPLSPPEARLLLLASRQGWSPAQRRLAAELVPQVRQWDVFADTAWRKFSVPMVHGNLAGLPDGAVPDHARAALRGLSLRMAADILRLRAAFDWVHARCVLPTGLAHAYYKGPALAERFYRDPMLRYFRDIDLLVRRRDRVAFIRALRAQGCRVVDYADGAPSWPDLDDPLALAEYDFVTPVPHLVTPQGLVIELHAEAEHHTALFDTGDLLARSVEVPAGRHRVRVLPDADHIVLLCYHHTGHLWSKLHWIADLDAILTDPSVDRGAVLECARRYNLEATVRAAFGLHDLTAAGHDPGAAAADAPALDLLRACVDGLPGGLALEQAMRRGQTLRMLAFRWQGRPVGRLRFVWLHLRWMLPTFADLRAVPGGRVRRYLTGVARKLARLPRALTGRVPR